MPLHPDNAARFQMFEHILDNISEAGPGLFNGCAPTIVACKTTAIAMFVSKQMRQWLDDRGIPYLPAAPREIVIGAKMSDPAVIFARPSSDLVPYQSTSDLFVDISLTEPHQEMIEMHSIGATLKHMVPGKVEHTYEVYSGGGWDDVLAELIAPNLPSLLDGLGKKKKLNKKLFGLDEPTPADDAAKKGYLDGGLVGWDGNPHLHPGYDDQHTSISPATYAASDFQEPLEALLKASNEIHEASKKGPNFVPFMPPVDFELTGDIVKGEWVLTARVQLGPKVIKAVTAISDGCIGKGPGMWDGTIDHPFLASLKGDLKKTLEAKICKAIAEASDTVLSMDSVFPDGVENAKVKGGKVSFDPKKHHTSLSQEFIEELSDLAKQESFDVQKQISTFKDMLTNALGAKGLIDHEGTKAHLLAQLKNIHFAHAYGAQTKVSDLIDAVFPATKKTPRTLHLIDGLGRKRVLEWDVDLVDSIDLPHPLPKGFVDSDPKSIIPEGTPITTFVLDEATKDEPIVTYWERV